MKFARLSSIVGYSRSGISSDDTLVGIETAETVK